jgi:tRNA (guanine-N7-)-methyltransferase
MPKRKSKFRTAKAHTHPLPDRWYPNTPADYTEAGERWAQLYPTSSSSSSSAVAPSTGPAYVDIGCGFGACSIAIGKALRERHGEASAPRVVGLEIRVKVVEYGRDRLARLRAEGEQHSNVAIELTNAMKLLPHYFAPQSLEAFFILFPDPHFKVRKHRFRIVSPALLSCYAALLKDGGVIYNVTDVKDLFDWTVAIFDAHPLFEPVPEADIDSDLAAVAEGASDEAQKVKKAGGEIYARHYRRVARKMIL